MTTAMDGKPQAITEWDWRYRVGFDEELRRHIKELANLCLAEERDVIHELLDYFSQIISIDCLIESILDGRNELLDLDFVSLEKGLLPLPSPCAHLVERKFNLVAKKYPEHTSGLRSALDTALSVDIVASPLEPLRIVFGDQLDFLIRYGQAQSLEVPYPNIANGRILSNVSSAVQEFLCEVANNEKLIESLGRFTLPQCIIRVEKGPGFAEYWPWFLNSRHHKNELIIYENSDSLREDQLIPTLNHELFPGHAFFYQQIEHLNPKFIDHGALALVEGWATWAEWHGIHEEFSTQARAFRLRTLPFIKLSQIADSLHITQSLQNEGYSNQTAIDGCLQFFQYPAMGASYTLGALWFENRFMNSSPHEFFRFMKKRNWGDFFRLW
jgi:hypothetical protein